MASRSVRVWNVLIWLAILVTSALFQSEIGGSDSPYNAMTVALIGLFIVINRRFDQRMLLAFGVALSFLALSVAANVDQLAPGGYRSAIATSVGYLMFTLRPVPFNQRLLRQVTIGFLIVAAVLSIQVSVSRGEIDFARDIANANFNVNPNSASMFFVGSIILALAVVGGLAGAVLAAVFLLLELTTGSRAGALAVCTILIGYAVVSDDVGVRPISRLRSTTSKFTVWLVIALGGWVALQLLPDAIDYLLLRFETGQSRADVWDAGLQAITSWRDVFIGKGPATLGGDGQSAHNSYLNAVGNSGILFLFSTLTAISVWLRRAASFGARAMLWVMPAVLMLGAVEEVLFNGVSTVWLVSILCSVALVGRAAERHQRNVHVPSSSSPGYRQLVEGHPLRQPARQL